MTTFHPEYRMTRFCLTVTCPSTRGLVAAIAGYLAQLGCNITDSAQFDAPQTGRFFMRLGFDSQQGADLDSLRRGFADTAEAFSMQHDFLDAAAKIKVIIKVSRFGQGLNDLLYRWRIGALPIDIVAAISNHMNSQKVVVN